MKCWLVLVAALTVTGCNSTSPESAGGGGEAGTAGTGGVAGAGGDAGQPGVGGAGLHPGAGGIPGDGGAGGLGGAGVGGQPGPGGSGGASGAGSAPDLCAGIECNDDNPCTDDSCDPESGCVFTPRDNGQVCGVESECFSGLCNLCPKLFIINSIPTTISEGNDSTLVETRGQETDGQPTPLTLTLSALWGSFENTENLQQPSGVVAQNATYICDRPGLVEICVEASDGACMKTLCDEVICPESIGEP